MISRIVAARRALAKRGLLARALSASTAATLFGLSSSAAMANREGLRGSAASGLSILALVWLALDLVGILRLNRIATDAESRQRFASRRAWLFGAVGCALVAAIDEWHERATAPMAIRRVLIIITLLSLGYLIADVVLRVVRALRRPRVRAATAQQIVTPPGWRLRGILAFLYSAKTMTNVFEPLLADMQHEWFEATIAGQMWRARWIVFRGYYDLAQHVGLQSVVNVAKLLVRLWRAA